MQDSALWQFDRGTGPLLATAIHNGHAVREELVSRMAIAESVRLREEDPFTGRLTRVAPNRLIVHRSRFEVDLNRPVEGAVYRTAGDAWGIQVWRDAPEEPMIERSLANYRAFYDAVRTLLDAMVARYGRVVVFDLHSYNHRRAGPAAPPSDPSHFPEINLGTGTMDRVYWAPVVDRFLRDLRTVGFQGRRLDVRENIVFRGGHFPRWIHATYPRRVCVLSIEIKKIFMDEWTGRADRHALDAAEHALRSTVWGVYEELFAMNRTDASRADASRAGAARGLGEEPIA